MGAPILLLDTHVRVEKTRGTGVVLTDITNATTGTATATGHSIANGAIGVLVVSGMPTLQGQAVRVASSAANTFALEGLNTVGAGTFASGTFVPITEWDTFDNLVGVDFPEPAPTRLDTTTANLTSKTERFGLDEAFSGTLNMQADPLDVAVANIRAASKAKASRVFEVTLEDESVMLFNAYVAGGRGLSGQVGQIMTGSAQVTLIGQELYFAT